MKMQEGTIHHENGVLGNRLFCFYTSNMLYLDFFRKVILTL